MCLQGQMPAPFFEKDGSQGSFMESSKQGWTVTPHEEPGVSGVCTFP